MEWHGRGRWRRGGRVNTRRGDLRVALQKLSTKRGGKVTPDELVKEARNPKSVFHREFTWDNTKAGHLWRLQEARELIDSVTYYTEVTKYHAELKVYVRDPRCAPTEQGYVETAVLRDQKDYARQALIYECKQALALMRRVREVALALGLEDEVDGILGQLAALHKAVAAA